MGELEEQKAYNAAIYVRLSREDKEKEESNSIGSQKELIRNFLEKQLDIVIMGEYVDDGYSGVDFVRPSFQRMIQDIKKGFVNCVVVKDLSRFGRNFIETGRYLEQIFPLWGVRFIAICDGIDSGQGFSSKERILIPFKNLINDAYSHDISIKIRSQLEIKRKKGEFIGSFAVYGYKKAAEDRHKLVIDEYAASVVQDIFKWKLQGISQQRIADRLNERGELSPMEYKRFCGLAYQSGFQVNLQAKWSAVTVGRILCNEYYIGTLVQGKRTTPNHKVKKVIQKPKEEWVRVENHHPPVIEREDFFVVRKLLLQDTRVAPKKQKVYLFSGLLFCGDCGQNMVRNSVKRNGKNYIYNMCGRNRTHLGCSSHRIRDCLLEQAIFLTIRQQIFSMVAMEPIFTLLEAFSKQTELEKIEQRLLEKQKEAERYFKLQQALEKAKRENLLDQIESMELEKIYKEKLKAVKEAEKKLGKEKENLLQNQRKGLSKIQQFQKIQNIMELTHDSLVYLIEKIDIYEGNRIQIQFRYKDSYLM